MRDKSDLRDKVKDNDNFQVKTIVNTLAAAAEAEERAAEERAAEERAAEDRRDPEADEVQQPRVPRTLLLPQPAPADERPHCESPTPTHRHK